jgi:hypothetical protein
MQAGAPPEVGTEGRDWMDACSLIAYAVRPLMARMSHMRFGQAELFLKPAWPVECLHVLIRSEAGSDVFYVSETPFMPYW